MSENGSVSELLGPRGVRFKAFLARHFVGLEGKPSEASESNLRSLETMILQDRWSTLEILMMLDEVWMDLEVSRYTDHWHRLINAGYRVELELLGEEDPEEDSPPDRPDDDFEARTQALFPKPTP